MNKELFTNEPLSFDDVSEIETLDADEQAELAEVIKFEIGDKENENN